MSGTAPWPKSGPDFNQWNNDAAALMRLIQDNPTLWHQDFELKYLSFRIDTRDGGFILSDRHGKNIEPERVLIAIAKIEETRTRQRAIMREVLIDRDGAFAELAKR